ncbi:MAG: flagellar protein FlaG [Candidatus Latescibacteria bacterium]|nr:flagellar protein FlaG [Candidatus Latescibacterota bacterium]
MNNISFLNTRYTHASQQSPEGTASSDKQKAAPAPAPAPTAGDEIGVAKTEALVKDLNSALEKVDGDYSVSVDNETGMVVVRITDAETGELVKQLPAQQVLDVSISVEKIIGLLVNDQG